MAYLSSSASSPPLATLANTPRGWTVFEMGEESAKVSAAIEMGAASWSKDMLREMLKEAARFKPVVDGELGGSYDALDIRRRHYYEGKQLPYIRRELEREYPATHKEMRPVSFGLFKLVCEQDSDVYRSEPIRKALLNGEADEVATEELGTMLKHVRAQMRLAEAGRRAQGSRAQFVRVWDSDLEDRITLQLFWPSDVWVIPHEGAPTSLEHARALIARVTGPTHDKWYEVWTRADGGPWTVSRISEKGERQEIVDGGVWPLRLPWAVLFASPPEGSPYPCDDQDLVRVCDSISLAWTELNHVIKTQAHDLLWHAGMSDSDQVWGPGYIFRVGTGEQVGSITQNPKIREIMDTIEGQLRTLARTRRQNPDAYSASPGAPQSGISRQIQNIPQEEARQERVAYAREFETGQLLPILAELWDASGRGSVALDVPGRSWSFTTPDQPTYEDPDRKQARALMAYKEGVIDKARFAYEAGWYESQEDAETALAEMAEAKRGQVEQARAGLPSVGERLLARRGE